LPGSGITGGDHAETLPGISPVRGRVLDKIAGAEVNAKTADARKTIFNSRPLDDALISDLIKESGAVELKAYGGSCTSRRSC